MERQKHLRLETASKQKIWVVEDDPSTLSVYSEILTDHYDPTLFEDLPTFWSAFRKKNHEPDLILADLHLGSDHFLHFLKTEQKAKPLPCPLIIVSGDDDLNTLRAGFEHGARDYLTKPFRKNELLVKVENILSAEAISGAGKTPLSGSIVFEPSTLTIRKGSSLQIHLTAKELQIYAILNRANGCRVSRRHLETEIWGETSVTSKSLDVHIFNLRKKLARLGVEISFSSPDGYALQCTKP